MITKHCLRMVRVLAHCAVSPYITREKERESKTSVKSLRNFDVKRQKAHARKTNPWTKTNLNAYVRSIETLSVSDGTRQRFWAWLLLLLSGYRHRKRLVNRYTTFVSHRRICTNKACTKKRRERFIQRRTGRRAWSITLRTIRIRIRIRV